VPEVFFDTNVLLYLLSEDPEKADRAERALGQGGMISVQVLNEFTAVARRKLSMDWNEIADFMGVFRSTLAIVPVTLEIHDAGRAIAERYGMSWYDSLIVAAAAEAGCSVLLSEDMHTGQVINNVTIRNPFA